MKCEHFCVLGLVNKVSNRLFFFFAGRRNIQRMSLGNKQETVHRHFDKSLCEVIIWIFVNTTWLWYKVHTQHNILHIKSGFLIQNARGVWNFLHFFWLGTSEWGIVVSDCAQNWYASSSIPWEHTNFLFWKNIDFFSYWYSECPNLKSANLRPINLVKITEVHKLFHVRLEKPVTVGLVCV